MRNELLTARLRLGPVLMSAALASLAAGCGDGPICSSDISVFITTPDDGDRVPLDGDDNIDAMTEVVVRTNLRATEQVQLQVMDDFGQMYYFISALVDESGTARFPAVFLPVGRVRLEARGITEQCGMGEDIIEVEVGGQGTSCVLEPALPPASNPAIGLPVYNTWYDLNGVFEGLQTDFTVYGPGESQIDLTLLDLDTGFESPAGTRFTDSTGIAFYSLTIPEGRQSLVARCSALDGSQTFTSTPFEVFVDTEAPSCALTAPTPGVELTPAMDLDGDPSNGTQIELVGEASDSSALAVPPPLFRVDDVLFEGTEVNDESASAVVVTLNDSRWYYLGIEVQDVAGNTCFDGLDFNFVSGSQLVVESVTRSSVELSWTAPGPDFGGVLPEQYELRIAQEPIDESNFYVTGEPYDIPPPAAPGTPESALVEGLAPGTTIYAALIAFAEGGGYHYLGEVGPLEIGFDATPAIAPVAPEDGENGLGYQVAAGDFNGDGFGDVAVSAPFKSVGGQGGAGAVYVYFGDAAGPGTTPGVTIEGDAASGQLGNGLTAIRWNDDDIDDLAIGAPFADAGQGVVSVFLGGAGFDQGTRSPTDADVTIRGSASAGNWFVAGGLGFALTRTRFDDDARDDLILTAPGGGNGNGGVVVLYGGATATSIALSSQSAAGSGDAVAVVLQDPDPGSIFGSDPGPFFGQYVFPLGRTQGAADTNDDIGVAYTEKNAAVVFRGRPQPPVPGVVLATFDPTRDLEIQRTSSDDRSSRFGTSMGTIADINNDGVREIVVGIWRDLANIGRIEIYRGNAVGVRNASNIRLRSITPSAELCSASGCGLGSAIVNNAAGLVDPDVNDDGVEDLIVVGGMDESRVRLMVWFGGSLPSTDFTSATANYVVNAPAEFAAGARGDSDATPLTALWAGDVNGDGLEDICWADWSAQSRDGAFQVLYDDGQ